MQSLIPAAEYLRMSTEQQQYSIENQVAVIEAYASRKGFEVIRTYSDAARSGLLLKNRPGLKQLLQDILSGTRRFDAILVYDISRWGRFEDADEAAHYEFLCKTAHVPVHYCAETFANDNSLPSTIMRVVKRAMAAEFSRELGANVFAAGRRSAELGFKQGGAPGFALNRLLVSSDGSRRQPLAKGEVKCLQSDRVILAPGDPQEVKLVREIFRLVVEEKRTPFYIAKNLNRRAAKKSGSDWTHQQVYRILTSPKYAGYNVWNRKSRRLGAREVDVPRSAWVVKEGAFEPVVEPRIFEQAQRVLAQRTCCQSNERLLDGLRALLAVKGKLTGEILAKAPGAPSASTCRKRFGNLRRAFQLAGQEYHCGAELRTST
jgi:DNA invertase Pin-like site-specific DNA recombinase